jgi:hypothetical protein
MQYGAGSVCWVQGASRTTPSWKPESTELQNEQTRFQKVCRPSMHPNHPCVHIERSLELGIFDKESCRTVARLE